MKTKFLFIFFLCLLSIGTYSQETVTIKDTVQVNDSLNDEYEVLEENKNEDTIRKAYLYTIDSSQYPYYPISNINDTLNALKNSKDYWYVNAAFKSNKKNTTTSNGESKWLNFLNSSVFKIIIWALIIAVVLTIIIVFLNENQINFFTKKSKKLTDPNKETHQEENIFDINYASAIDKAISANDFATATRLQYLQVLLLLHQKGTIVYTKEKTNFDYLMSLSNTSYYKDFATATRNYEFVWYGDFELTKEQYKIIETVFINLKKQIQ
jgi:hypothetical protein